MAKVSKIVKSQRPPKYKVRHRNRCGVCGRSRAFIRRAGLCRLCFRKLALQGHLPGIKKSSW